MGSWCKTCGLSGLHITAGEQVYVFVLEKNNILNDQCYSTAFYRPFLLPFYSEYDDYGGGENSYGVAFQPIMEAICKKLVELDVGENEYHDIAVTRDKFGESLFFEAVHEHRLKVKLHSLSTETNLEFVMFRKDIVDYILANWGREDYVGAGQGTSGWNNSYIQYGFQDIINDIPEFMTILEAKVADQSLENKSWLDSVPPELRLKLMSTLMGFDSMFDYNEKNKVARWMRGDRYRYLNLLSIQDLIVTALVTDQDREKAEMIITDYLKANYIDAFMHETRKVWLPGAHEGSQSNETQGYRVMCDAICKVINEQDRDRDEDE